MTGKKLFFALLLLLTGLASCRKESGTDEKTPPNFLFAISDDQSFPHAGAYVETAI